MASLAAGLATGLTALPCYAAPKAPCIIPKPVHMDTARGRFTLDGETRILYMAGNAEAEQTAHYAAAVLRPATGLPLPVEPAEDSAVSNVIALEIVAEAPGGNPEGYRLESSRARVRIHAATGAGLFYGVQTLRQLLPPEILQPTLVEMKWTAPAVTIEDYPRFAWRGMLLDVARYFMPKEFVKKFIDAIALHKMNRLHLHLTDDQGWRIEIKKYPKLTEVGAWRAETLVGRLSSNGPQAFDGKPHGGFYTQDDIRELVAYAQERHITLMPEIEMPGHAQAAIAAYPELGNVKEPLPVRTFWGVNENIFNVEDSTLLFLQDVLAEVIELFPSQYIHIGGDEAVKNQWEASEAVQARMKALGIQDEHGMQSYFIARMNDFLMAHDRKLIGWDEIMEGGLGTSATVMAWRDVKRGIEAAREGHDVVMAPTKYTYFDYYQGERDKEPLAIGGNLPLASAYAFDPLPEQLPPEQHRHILGAQGQLWSEYISTPDHMEYMAFPRTCALAEIVWTPQADREYDDFVRRLKAHVQRLDEAGLNYRPLDND